MDYTAQNEELCRLLGWKLFHHRAPHDNGVWHLRTSESEPRFSLPQYYSNPALIPELMKVMSSHGFVTQINCNGARRVAFHAIAFPNEEEEGAYPRFDATLQAALAEACRLALLGFEKARFRDKHSGM